MEALAREIWSSYNSIAFNLVEAAELGFLFLTNYMYNLLRKFFSLNFIKYQIFLNTKKTTIKRAIYILDITME